MKSGDQRAKVKFQKLVYMRRITNGVIHYGYLFAEGQDGLTKQDLSVNNVWLFGENLHAWMWLKLMHFRGRILRDDWVGRARILAAGPMAAKRPFNYGGQDAAE